MAKKFFNQKVHNTRRTIINLIIIGVCVIGIIICFIVTRHLSVENRNKQGGELALKDEVLVEVNENFNKDIFFSKIVNVDVDNIKIVYPDNYDISKPATYEVTIEINNKPYKRNLVVVDTLKPELTLKDVTIKKGETYSSNDFVESCTDNSNTACNIEFYQNGVDEQGNAVDYTKYSEVGNYAVKIRAYDDSNNEIINEAKLTITENKPTPPIVETKPVNCKFGDATYDTNQYLLAVDITTNGCAISLDLYKDTSSINKLLSTETMRISKDISALNLGGTLTINRNLTAVTNTSGSGIVGYEISITTIITNNNENKTIAVYKVNNKGKRVFTENPYNLSE